MEMTILPNRFLFFDLFIDRVRNKAGDLRVKDLKVTRGGKTVAHWQTVPSFSALERLWIGFDRSPITVSYTIDPFVKKGNRGKMLSYLTDQYGYFRGMYILYTPITFTQTIAFLAKKPIPQNWPGVGTVQFDLPVGWEVNDPWVSNSEKISLADFKNTYWGFGQDMEIKKSKNLSIGIIEKLNEDKKTATYQNIIRIYRTIEEITGLQLKRDASFWAVSILPPVPIHGGSSGNYSLLTEDGISFISHEIFHWWNGFALKSSNEASWIQEGFTEYYEGKVLLKAGIWSDNDFN
ncbi:MAG: hypothetical protein MI862_05990, partial [Desulfobacterales bacterium]|nr:hypothetical protein [Desulfobacterales bacterium]